MLDGALALALPTQPGQQLELQALEGRTPRLYWQSLDHEGERWFEAVFRLPDLSLLESSDPTMGERLASLLQAARQQAPDFLSTSQSLLATTRLDFPRLWGLGTSSTLVHLLASWAQVDPFQLLAATFGGSGYDIACAAAKGPILYQRREGQPWSQPVDFHPPFKDQLYFVYLGQKQNSREGIARYRARKQELAQPLKAINALTEQMLHCSQLADFEALIREHETLVAQHIGLPKAYDRYFSDYWGAVKSLGAWGGDFVLLSSARSEAETSAYCNEKGFGLFMKYRDLIL